MVFKNRKAVEEKMKQVNLNAKKLFVRYGYHNCVAWRDMTSSEINEMIPVIESCMAKSSLRRVPSFTELRRKIWPKKYKAGFGKITDTIAYLKDKIADRETRIRELEKELRSARIRIEHLEKQLNEMMAVG